MMAPEVAHKSFPPTVSELASRFSIPVCRYVLYCLVASLILRLISCLFKARGIQGREHLTKDHDKNEYTEFWKAYLIAFRGVGGGRIEDLWLPYLLGVCELAAYPVLFAFDRFEVVGGWLILKVAGSWRVWTDLRTPFNRFLFLNLLILAIAYFWLFRYIR
jgi:hypothetical protein